MGDETWLGVRWRSKVIKGRCELVFMRVRLVLVGREVRNGREREGDVRCNGRKV